LVLIADDEPAIIRLVSIALREDGFRVISASGGEDALAKAEEVRPDIVLLDIVMPDLDGIEVMRRLREYRPVPVILLSTRRSVGDTTKGLDLGADDYLVKPFHPDELAARVRAVIRRASADSRQPQASLRPAGSTPPVSWKGAFGFGSCPRQEGETASWLQWSAPGSVVSPTTAHRHAGVQSPCGDHGPEVASWLIASSNVRPSSRKLQSRARPL